MSDIFEWAKKFAESPRPIPQPVSPPAPQPEKEDVFEWAARFKETRPPNVDPRLGRTMREWWGSRAKSALEGGQPLDIALKKAEIDWRREQPKYSQSDVIELLKKEFQEYYEQKKHLAPPKDLTFEHFERPKTGEIGAREAFWNRQKRQQKELQEIQHPIITKKKEGKTGLGFFPSREEVLLAKQEGRIEVPLEVEKRLRADVGLKQRIQKEMAARGQSIPADWLEGVLETASLMMEFFLTGKLAKGVKVSASAWTALKLGLKPGSVLPRVIGEVAAAVARTPVQAPRIAGEAIQREAGILEMMPDGTIKVVKGGQTPAMAVADAFAGVVLGNIAEGTGETITKGGSRLLGALNKIPILGRKIPGLDKFVGSLASAWATKTGGTINDGIRKLFSRAGYSSFLGELGEERVEDIFYALSGVETYGVKGPRFSPTVILKRLFTARPSWRDLLVEAGVLAVPGAAQVGARVATAPSRKRVANALGTSVNNLPSEVATYAGRRKWQEAYQRITEQLPELLREAEATRPPAESERQPPLPTEEDEEGYAEIDIFGNVTRVGPGEAGKEYRRKAAEEEAELERAEWAARAARMKEKEIEEEPGIPLTADDELKKAKSLREVGRGERPPGVVEIPPTGIETVPLGPPHGKADLEQTSEAPPVIPPTGRIILNKKLAARLLAELKNAARKGDEAKVQRLIERGVDINKQNSLGETPLFSAVRYGELNAVKLLLKHGADIDIKTHADKTVMGEIERILENPKHLPVFDEIAKNLHAATKAKQITQPVTEKVVPPVARQLGKPISVGMALELEQEQKEVAERTGEIPKPKPKVEKIKPEVQPKPTLADVLKEQQIKGKPWLANPAKAPGARELVNEADEKIKQLNESQRFTNEAITKEANERLEKNYEAEKANILKTANMGGQLNPVETIIAKEIINREGLAAILSGNPAKIENAIALIMAYRRTGTVQSVAFHQRYDPVETPKQRMTRAILEAILHMNQKWTKQYDAALAEGDKAKLDELIRQHVEEVKRLQEVLRKCDIDLSGLEGLNELQLAAVLKVLQTAKGDIWDCLYEWWHDAILSAPTTQVANLLGIGYGAWYFTAERLLEAVINLGLRQKTGAQLLGELKYVYAGFLPSLSVAAHNFIMTWHTGIDWFEMTHGMGRTKIETGPVIAGEKGEVIRIPRRLITSIDAFQKTIFARLAVGGWAYRIAKAEGLQNEKLQARIQDLMLDLKSDAWIRAANEARVVAFHETETKIGEAIVKGGFGIRAAIPGVRYNIPFIGTPVAITEKGLIALTPVAWAVVAKQLYHGIRTGKYTGLSASVARGIIGTAIFLALLGNDEDDPWITGAESEEDWRARTLSKRAYQPQSIRIEDAWYSYARIEPFATALALQVDTVQALKRGGAPEGMKAFFNSMIGMLEDKTFVRGLADVFRVVSGRAPGGRPEAALKWASDFVASWVPNVIKSTGRAMDIDVPERGIWGRQGWSERLWRRTIQKTELGLIPDFPRYDVWGRKLPRGIPDKPGSDFVWRLIIPIQRRKIDVFPADLVLLRWNNQNPEDEVFPPMPSKYFTFRKIKYEHSDETFDQYSREAGELSRQFVEKIQFKDSERPVRYDVFRIMTAVKKAHKIIRNKHVREWAETALPTKLPPEEE